MDRVFSAAGWLLALTAAVAAGLALVWPFVRSTDPAATDFRLYCIVTLAVFLLALTLRCAVRLLHRR